MLVFTCSKDSGGKSQSVTVLNRLERNEMEVFVIIEAFSRDNLCLCELFLCTHPVTQCLRLGSSEQSRTCGQVSGVLRLLNQWLAAGGLSGDVNVLGLCERQQTVAPSWVTKMNWKVGRGFATK